MKIRGKEINFLRTTKTTADLAEICPDKDINRLGELFTGDVSKTIHSAAKFIQILNEGYEMNKKLEAKELGDTYEPHIIDLEDILYLDEDTFIELQNEALSAYNGVKTTVELEDTKKKVKTKEEI